MTVLHQKSHRANKQPINIHTPPQPSVSIIIPTLNEAKVIQSTLESIFQQNYSIKEVIIVDGGSSDTTCQMVKTFADTYFKTSPKSSPNTSIKITLIKAPEKGRALQMNLGAEHASGDWLLFTHADTLLPKDAVKQIAELDRQKHIHAGCFKHVFSRPHPLLGFISWLHNFRCRKTRIIYGDQSMFCRQETFFKLGKFPNQVMEDIRFSERLVAITKPVILDASVVTDSRKFEQRGILRSLLDVVIILTCYQLKRPIPNISSSFFSEVR